LAIPRLKRDVVGAIQVRAKLFPPAHANSRSTSDRSHDGIATENAARLSATQHAAMHRVPERSCHPEIRTVHSNNGLRGTTEHTGWAVRDLCPRRRPLLEDGAACSQQRGRASIVRTILVVRWHNETSSCAVDSSECDEIAMPCQMYRAGKDRNCD
jgi:hypothetical protein